MLKLLRDLVFAVLRRRKKELGNVVLVERRSTESVVSKLANDIYDIVATAECPEKTLPKNLYRSVAAAVSFSGSDMWSRS